MCQFLSLFWLTARGTHSEHIHLHSCRASCSSRLLSGTKKMQTRPPLPFCRVREPGSTHHIQGFLQGRKGPACPHNRGCCPAQGERGKCAPTVHQHVMCPACSLQGGTIHSPWNRFWPLPRHRCYSGPVALISNFLHCLPKVPIMPFTERKMGKTYGERQEETKSGRKEWSKCVSDQGNLWHELSRVVSKSTA